VSARGAASGAGNSGAARSSNGNGASLSRPRITFEIPPPADSQYLFRRTFIAKIRSAIAQAQTAGEIDTPTAIACFKCLPIADPPQPPFV
jgi:hypothetical protein